VDALVERRLEPGTSARKQKVRRRVISPAFLADVSIIVNDRVLDVSAHLRTIRGYVACKATEEQQMCEEAL
jgi:hypothetical protein